MDTRRNITDLKSLQEAKAELQAEVAAKEISIRLKFEHLKSSLFDFSKIKDEGISWAKDLLSDKFGMISAALSGFIVNNVIRPKNKWLRKISAAGVGFLVKKYSGIIEKKIKSLLT